MIFRFGDCSLDVASRHIGCQGCDRHLSPKAFDLLLILLEARPRVIGKEELMNRVWPEAFVSEANLAVLIGEVREAIGDRARDSLFIKTHHGVGYSFIGAVSEQARVPRVPLPGPTFVLHAGQRRIMLLPGTMTVGRDDHCDVILADPSVSRQHARFHVEGPRLLLEDLQSKNGTRVEGAPVNGRTSVTSGQEIVFGNVLTRVIMEQNSDTTTVTLSGLR